ncbi:MAG: DUF2095 family protein [Desulfurococcus sp.]|nr:DUF2095 family protein [Desulfurococcus sp.]
MTRTYRIEDFKEKYPNLAREILDGEGEGDLKIIFDASYIDPWKGYLPSAIDYIRRCKTVEEALEVLDYLVKHEELSVEEGVRLRRILEEKGLEYFGRRKEDDYYYKEARKFWRTLNRLLRGNAGLEARVEEKD